MIRETDRFSNGRIRTVVGLCLLAVFLLHVQGNSVTAEPGDDGTVGLKAAAGLETVGKVALANADFEGVDRELTRRQLAQEDPLGFLRYALANYENSVRDYTCRFIKKERILGRMSKAQEIDVRFKEQPFSVIMHWVKNADQARRVLYVDDRWLAKDGTEQALCEPEGAIARFFVSSVLRPIHGSDARKSSRRTIDQFGFGNTLRLILKYSEIAEARGEVSLRFIGESVHDGHPTYKFERRLPYTGAGGLYPDHLLVYHIDQETLLPVRCESFADTHGTKLLGSYQMTNVALNVGLTDRDFDKSNVGL